MKHARNAIGMVVYLLFLCSAMSAQNVAVSQISGTVKDSSGALLPNAQITVTQTATGLSKSTMTDAGGAYLILNLPLGPYSFEATLAGFEAYVQKGIVLQVGTAPEINITMQIGSVSQQVEVTAEAPLVETQSTSVNQLMDNTRLVGLPLNGRQVTDLLLLSGGAVTYSTGSSTGVPSYGGSGGGNGGYESNRNYPTVPISIAGSSPGSTLFILDGGSHNDPANNLNLPVPFPDALQEFSVQTSALPARYGEHAAGVVNLVTKSGTNGFHGDAFEFLRNGIFDARNYFALTRDTLKRSQFGGTLGGPIFRGKLFFFAGYQQTNVHSDPVDNITVVPTQAMLNGDFTAFTSPACNNGTQVTLKAPFVGNKINPALFNSSALAVLNHIPVTTNPCGTYTYGVPQPNYENLGIGRLDYQMNDRQSMFARYSIGQFYAPPFYQGDALTTPSIGQHDRGQSLTLGDTYVLTPNVTNSFRATGTRSNNFKLPAQFFSSTDLGVNMYNQIPGFTSISITGGFSVGGAGNSYAHYSYSGMQFADDLDIVHGAHHFSLGVDFMRTYMDGFHYGWVNGAFTFNGQTTGSGLGDFLLGDVSAFEQSATVLLNERYNYWGAYGQDTWKINSHLTLNVGLRWEPYFPFKTFLASHFDMNDFLQGVKSKIYPNAPAGLLFPGDPGDPTGNSMNNGNLANFAPRIGLSYDPRGKGLEVIRASYGIFYDLPGIFFFANATSRPPFANNLTVNTVNFSNPWATYPGGNPFPYVVSPNAPFPLFANYWNMPSKMKPWYLQEWNLSLQKQFGQNWSVTLSYIGSETTHFWTGTDVNPATYIPGTSPSGAALSTTANTNQRRILYLDNPAQGQYYSEILQGADNGTGDYNSGLLVVQKRFSNHFSAVLNYNYSHCINDSDSSLYLVAQYQNPKNIDAERATCGGDITHVLNVSGVADTPQFDSRLAETLLGHWEASPIFSARTGVPLSIANTVDTALVGSNNQRPNLVGDPNLSDPTASKWFNTAAFALPPTGMFGDVGRDSLRGPGYKNVNLALSRIFPITERQSIEFRAEAFNLFNHTNLFNPVTTFSSSLFGKVISAADPRIMQFALKYVF